MNEFQGDPGQSDQTERIVASEMAAFLEWERSQLGETPFEQERSLAEQVWSAQLELTRLRLEEEEFILRPTVDDVVSKTDELKVSRLRSGEIQESLVNARVNDVDRVDVLEDELSNSVRDLSEKEFEVAFRVALIINSNLNALDNVKKTGKKLKLATIAVTTGSIATAFAYNRMKELGFESEEIAVLGVTGTGILIGYIGILKAIRRDVSRVKAITAENTQVFELVTENDCRNELGRIFTVWKNEGQKSPGSQ
jgi:hypothetical protein